MSQSKPSLTIADVHAVIHRHWNEPVDQIRSMEGGNFSSAFSFTSGSQVYVIRFALSDEAYETEHYIAKLLTTQGVLYSKIFVRVKEGPYTFCISERMEGIAFADLQHEQKVDQLPELVRVISDMNQVQLDSQTTGYGWITPSGNGVDSTWDDYIRAFFAEKQPGSFWDNWYALFETSCLERDVVEEIYARLLKYSKYNAPHRYFGHGDCHEWNILSDGSRIRGIIDSNGIYGDFLIDIATIESAVPGHDVAEAFRKHYEKIGVPIPDFQERMIGARYFKGLDGLRFYAKMGWDHAYVELRDRLLALP
ncbi:phosphotransferase [Paenibacillus terrigena]|uniref:phosphotransferase family protein n=1 Tax=Paenibacillus terrigena TaxID=369333 RepID=UPI0028D6377F|nr:phosphotransferase [Paenibacillus terrigena]